jgi:MFS family permease
MDVSRDPEKPDRYPRRGPSAVAHGVGNEHRVDDVGASAGALASDRTTPLRRMLVPLALAQFICSYAGSNMNVAINDIRQDLDTTVQGVQVAITLFLLCMAALMIPGSKLTDRWGRKRCFVAGLVVYGVGAFISAVAPSLGILVVGYSVFEGVGSALLIPPVYILTTVLVEDVRSRARAFGIVSAMAGIGAAAGPLIGGFITTTISWRASFLLQAAVVGTIILLARRIVDPIAADQSRRFDVVGAVLSAAGMFLVVVGILQAGDSTALMVAGLAAGSLLLGWFFLHIRSAERSGREPLLSTRLFGVATANVALVTQHIQWLLLMGIAFVVSAFLQVVRGYSAIETGLVFTAATAGILVSSLGAERLAEGRSQRSLIRAGFVTTVIGIVCLLVLVTSWSGALPFVPGLLLIGLGVGVMLTPSVNVVQSSFPEELQGEISGLSRSVSNLGSSVGTAIAGTILVADIVHGNRSYAMALITLAGIGVLGLIATFVLASGSQRDASSTSVRVPEHPGGAVGSADR